MFETPPRYEPLETISRPIFQLKITVSTLATRMQRKKNAGAKNRLLPMLIIVKDNKFGKESIILTIPSPCIAPRN